MRPKASLHRDNLLVFRVYSVEKKSIEIAAQKSGLSLSDYVRRCCLEKEIRPRMGKEELELYRLLIEYRNNFSRISNLMKERKDFEKDLKEVISSIDTHLKRFTL